MPLLVMSLDYEPSQLDASLKPTEWCRFSNTDEASAFDRTHAAASHRRELFSDQNWIMVRMWANVHLVAWNTRLEAATRWPEGNSAIATPPERNEEWMDYLDQRDVVRLINIQSNRGQTQMLSCNMLVVTFRPVWRGFCLCGVCQWSEPGGLRVHVAPAWQQVESPCYPWPVGPGSHVRHRRSTRSSTWQPKYRQFYHRARCPQTPESSPPLVVVANAIAIRNLQAGCPPGGWIYPSRLRPEIESQPLLTVFFFSNLSKLKSWIQIEFQLLLAH